MAERTRLLIIDSSQGDRELARMMLAREFPAADLSTVADAAALLEQLAGEAPALVVLAARLDGLDAGKIRALLQRSWPGVPVVLFGHENDVLARCLNPGTVLAAIVRKSSAGFMALPEIARDVLAARGAGAPATAGVSLESLPLGAVRCRPDGRIAAHNARFAAALGRRADACVESNLDALCADAAARETWTAFLAGTAPHCRVPLLDGAGELHVERTPAGLLGCLVPPGGGALRVLGAARERPSAELSDMALVFSHDLKQPVQQIARLAQRLDDDASIDRAQLRRQLRSAAERAGKLLDDMTEYLAISLRETRPGLVELNDCLEQALAHLEVEIDQSGARIVATSLPAVIGDAQQLTHLLVNLVGNAIKFRGRDRPEIRIGLDTDDASYCLSIADNGIGIASAQRERVFEPGRRLHTQEEYPGSGLGLALCRRIVERHGGTIRIEDGTGGGTTVLVELPRPPLHVTRLA
ncbi:MAG: ATP-binding protein [Gammaproteobacteria bacterium]